MVKAWLLGPKQQNNHKYTAKRFICHTQTESHTHTPIIPFTQSNNQSFYRASLESLSATDCPEHVLYTVYDVHVFVNFMTQNDT